MTRVAAAKVLGFRVRRHLLDRRVSASPAEVARTLCGLHAQLAATAELSVWARVEGLGRDDVREALEEERTLVKTWAMRGTLHLLASDDLPLYVAVLGPRWDDPGGAWLRGFGVTREQYDAILEGVPRALGARPKTREQLADKLGELGGPELREKLLSGWGALLKPSARRGHLVFGPNRGRNVTFVRPDRWLGRLPRVETEDAEREILRRFLAAYGPATADDVRRWLGMSVAKLKRMLRALEDELVEVELSGTPAWLLAVRRRRAAGFSEAEVGAAPACVRPVRGRLSAPLVARRSRARAEDLPPAGLVLAGRARRRPCGRDLGTRAPRAPSRGPGRAVHEAERGDAPWDRRGGGAPR